MSEVAVADELREEVAARRAVEVKDGDGEDVVALDLARRKLKLPTLRRVVKRGPSNALYDLELEDRTLISLGTSGDLMNPRKVEAAIADATDGVTIDHFTAPKFRPIARALFAIAEVEDTGSSESEETLGWLRSFFNNRADRVSLSGEGDGIVIDDVLEDPDSPCFEADDGRLYLRLELFVRYVRDPSCVGQRAATSREVAARLARLGFEKHRFNERRGERVLKGRFWRSTVGFDLMEDE